MLFTTFHKKIASLFEFNIFNKLHNTIDYQLINIYKFTKILRVHFLLSPHPKLSIIPNLISIDFSFIKTKICTPFFKPVNPTLLLEPYSYSQLSVRIKRNIVADLVL